MKFLLDTHVLIWLTSCFNRIPEKVFSLLEEPTSELFFSDVSLWEIAIKKNLGRINFQISARELRAELLDHGYYPLPITGEHVVSVETLPLLHKDPFDRLLITQATIERMTLLTSDKRIAKYPGPIQKI